MQRRPLFTAFIASMLATAAWAQSTPKPLNLTLPPENTTSASATPAHNTGAAPAAATSVAAAATTDAPPSPASQPGMYYGDTSASMGHTRTAEQQPVCDDSNYNSPQIHGSIGTGMVAGSHIGGNYQTGTLRMSQAFGSCDHPTGGVSISIGASQSHFHHHER